jgi:enoyl-CoA hydratase/carnithine racemase
VIDVQFNHRVATIALNDPAKRNALSTTMFDALDAALARVFSREDVSVLVMRGRGPAFCAGFDLAAAVNEPSLMGTFILRLSTVLRAMRRGPQVVIGAAHGAAIAGGCALVSACDLVVASSGTKFGYPVHRLGISPAVTIPTLVQKLMPGAARSLLTSGEIIDGVMAHRLGLASRLVERDEDVADTADALAAVIARHGPHALAATKRWLNELDGSMDDRRFDAPAEDSAALAGGDEAALLLRTMWKPR